MMKNSFKKKKYEMRHQFNHKMKDDFFNDKFYYINCYVSIFFSLC